MQTELSAWRGPINPEGVSETLSGLPRQFGLQPAISVNIMYYLNIAIAKDLQRNSMDGGHRPFFQVYGYEPFVNILTNCRWTFFKCPPFSSWTKFRTYPPPVQATYP